MVDVAVVAGTAVAVVFVVEDVVASGVSGSSLGTEEAADVVVVDVAVVLDATTVGAAVTAGSEVSSAPGTGGKPCASSAASGVSATVAVSGCAMAAVPATAAVGAEPLSLLVEQADASKAATVAAANKNFVVIRLDGKMNTQQYYQQNQPLENPCRSASENTSSQEENMGVFSAVCRSLGWLPGLPIRRMEFDEPLCDEYRVVSVNLEFF